MNNIDISNRLFSVPSSPIRKLVPYAINAKKKGIKVYHLNIGDPDVKTPDVMIKFLKSWNKNPIGYGQSKGEPEFLDALVWYYHKLGYPFIESKNIQVTTGGSEAIDMVFYAICEDGDEVLVFEPFYTNYNYYAVVNKIKLVPVLTKGNNGFHLPKKSEIEKKINKKTKAIFICNPNNPTGTAYTKEEINMLVEIAKEKNLFLISDEVYREYIYDGKTHNSVLKYMKKMPLQIILLDSMSKRYSLCGLRLGVLLTLNKEIMDGVLRLAQGRLSSGSLDQAIAAKLTEVPDSYIRNVQIEYQNRRDVIYNGLSSIPGVFLEKPEGAFYAIVKLPVFDAEHFCKWLLTDFNDNNETVMLAPAAGFYATPGMGKNEVRVAYVINCEKLKRCVEILRKALYKYVK